MASSAVSAASTAVRFLPHRERRYFRARGIQTQRTHACAASNHRCEASSSHSKNTETTTSVALKEWGAVVAALASGEQTVLFRKGGLRDVPSGKTKGFTVKYSMFALFPTNYHPNENASDGTNTKEKLSHVVSPDMHKGESVPLTVCATVTGAWTTMDPGVLELLTAHHVWSKETLSSRLKWKPDVPILVLELRAFEIDTSKDGECILPPDTKKYGGCASWVDLPEDMCVRLGQPSLSDDAFKEKQKALRAALGNVEYRSIE